MAKFVTNNNNFAFTKLILLLTLKDLCLCINFDIIDFLNTIICK